MDTRRFNPNREPAIWASLIQSPGNGFSPQAAEYLLSIRFGDNDVARIRQLVERSKVGELTGEERTEF